MASNPLLGSQISLISKKNIRYDGILYSINEADATVALQDVKSFGTEGRELLDASGMSTFVPPNDAVHAYLLFRGQDIKDLHVHEKQPAAAADPPSVTPPPPATLAPASAPQAKATAPAKAPAPAKTQQQGGGKTATAAPPQQKKQPKQQPPQQQQKQQQQQTQQQKKQQQPKEEANTKAAPVVTLKKENEVPKASQSSTDGSSSTNNRHPNNKVGMGASLLNRKTRGPKGEEPTVDGEFDFESNLDKFDKDGGDNTADDGGIDDGNDAYSKDDFFDTISCEATDRMNGVNNHLRGAAERSLNLDTFGAVSLGNQYGRGRGRGGGRGGGYMGGGRGGYMGGRGGGRGRGRGRGGYQHGNRDGGGSGDYNNNNRDKQGSGPTPRQNNRWKETTATAAH